MAAATKHCLQGEGGPTPNKKATAMNRTSKIAGNLVACLMVAAVFLAISTVKTGNAQTEQSKEPVSVGSAGDDGAGAPAAPTPVSLRTGNGPAAGSIAIDVKNKSGKRVTDVHVRLKDANVRIVKISTVGGGAGSPMTSNDPDGTQQDGGGENDTRPEGSSKVPPENPGGLDSDEGITIQLEVEHFEGGQWVKKEGSFVNAEIWWTRGENRNIVVSATSPNEVGDGDPRALIANISTQHELGLVMGPADVVAGSESGTCNDLTIGECDGFRFQNGCLVISPSNSARFTGAESVIAYNMGGEVVSGTSLVSVSNLRVDVRGNFVVDIQRDQQDEEHIFLVIRGAQLTKVAGNNDVGQEVHAKVSGAAVAGYCMKDYFHLITVVP
jgi:hypothetical protein